MFEGEVIVVDDDGQMQAYGREDETLQRGDLRTVYDGYGLSRRPPAGTAIIVQEMGDDLVVVGTEYGYRPDLAPGETRVWAGDNGESYLQLYPDSMEQLLSQFGHYLKMLSNKVELYSDDGAGCELGTDALFTSPGKTSLVGTLTRLGSSSATNPLVKGTELSTTNTTMWTAMQTALDTMKSSIEGGTDAETALTTYCGTVSGLLSTFLTAIASWVSTKNFLDT